MDGFFDFFQNPSRRPFREGSSANLRAKMRLWSHFGISGGPKIDPWSGIFSEKVMFLNYFFPPGASWTRSGRDLAPKRLQGRIFIDLGSFFGRFLMDFTSFLIDFSCYVRYICWLFREGFGMNFATL